MRYHFIPIVLGKLKHLLNENAPTMLGAKENDGEQFVMGRLSCPVTSNSTSRYIP